MRLLSNDVCQQVDKGIIHPYSACHYEMLDAIRNGDAKKAGSLMVQDIEATQRLLQKLC